LSSSFSPCPCSLSVSIANLPGGKWGISLLLVLLQFFFLEKKVVIVGTLFFLFSVEDLKANIA